jgi:hypothetical protein
MLRTTLISLLLSLSTFAMLAQDEMFNARNAYDEGEYESALIILTEFLEKGATTTVYFFIEVSANQAWAKQMARN